MPKQSLTHDLFLKFLSALMTASALKMASDISEIKTTVAIAVTRVEQQEVRLHNLEDAFQRRFHTP